MTEWSDKGNRFGVLPGKPPGLYSRLKIMRRLEPKKGAIAICGIGTVGVITSDGPVPVKYLDGNEGIAWTGIHLGFGVDGLDREVQIAPGDMWSSRHPRVIAESIEDLLVQASILNPPEGT